jgi:hypothetical protein
LLFLASKFSIESKLLVSSRVIQAVFPRRCRTSEISLNRVKPTSGAVLWARSRRHFPNRVT